MKPIFGTDVTRNKRNENMNKVKWQNEQNLNNKYVQNVETHPLKIPLIDFICHWCYSVTSDKITGGNNL